MKPAKDWNCPACGSVLSGHTEVDLKYCELMLRICSYDKGRSFTVTEA